MSSLKALTVGHKIFYFAYLFLVLLSPQAASALAPPIALYTFQAGSGATVYDVSGNGTPLNLEIAQPENTRWIPGGGLTIQQATIVASHSPATKITDALRVSNALTIEAWITPGNMSQAGPARIITLSANTRNRNMTVGQSKSALDIRLRTTRTDVNGMPSSSSAKGILSSQLTHLVYTRDSKGVVQLFINGNQLIKNRRRGSLGNWDVNHVFALANEITGERPWIGSYYQIAVYDRVFTGSEIASHLSVGPTPADRPNDYAAGNSSSTIGYNATGNFVSANNDGSAVSSASANVINQSASVGGRSISLGWKAPVARASGEALAMNDLAGYTLYYGTAEGIYPNSIDINDPYVTSTTISGLIPDTYYFVVTARDTAGRESSRSNTTIKNVF